jgi:hypothetical protein
MVPQTSQLRNRIINFPAGQVEPETFDFAVRYSTDVIWKGENMRKTAIAIGTVAALAVASAAPAEARRGFGPGLIGGLAAGAILAGAASGAYAYGPGYGYYGRPYGYYPRRAYYRPYGYGYAPVYYGGPRYYGGYGYRGW